MMLTGDTWRLFRAAVWLSVVALGAFAGVHAAFGHDWKNPGFDEWYGSLHRPHGGMGGFTSCCSKTDCHETEAEIRGADWWARIGKPDGNGNWELLDWVKVPADVVLENQNNPTGAGVLCHSIDWVGNQLDPRAITIFCFVPPMES